MHILTAEEIRSHATMLDRLAHTLCKHDGAVWAEIDDDARNVYRRKIKSVVSAMFPASRAVAEIGADWVAQVEYVNGENKAGIPMAQALNAWMHMLQAIVNGEG